MKKYKVLKDLPRAKSGYILIEGLDDDLVRDSDLKGLRVLDALMVRDALEEGFIEEVKPKRWRAEHMQICYRLNGRLEVVKAPFGGSAKSEKMYEIGNHFKNRETAQLVAEALKVFFEYLHKPDTQDGEPAMDFAAFYKAREAVAKE